MGKRIVVNAGVTETRLAVQDGNLLTELYVERADRRSIVGNVYKGVVTNVLPGMQAAFVDIGLSKDAFLYAGDYTANLGVEEHAPDAEDVTADHGLDDQCGVRTKLPELLLGEVTDLVLYCRDRVEAHGVVRPA